MRRKKFFRQCQTATHLFETKVAIVTNPDFYELIWQEFF